MTLDRSTLAQTLLHAPAWARVGLTAPSERVREASARELAEVVIGSLEDMVEQHDARQIALPL